MYHIEKINQAPTNKNLKQTRFSSNYSQPVHYTLTERKIIRIFSNYHSAPWIKLSNAYIAKIVGCSERTVIRTTNKFHKNGLVTKHRENSYSSNNYILGKNLHHQNVTPNKSLLFNLSLSSKTLVQEHVVLSTDSKTRTYGRAKERYKLKNVNVFKKGTVMNDTQKQLIRNNRHDPRVKNMMSDEKIRADLIHPTIVKITTLLTLDEKEQFKLIAYPEDALEYAFSVAAPIVAGKRVLHKPVKNRMAWFLKIADVYCQEHALTPDWKWYYDLCDITGMTTNTGDAKPLTVHKPKQQVTRSVSTGSPEEQLAQWEKHAETYGGIHGPSQHDKNRIKRLKQEIEDKTPTKGESLAYDSILQLPFDAKIDKLQSELAIHQQRYAMYNGPEYMKGLLRRIIERTEIDLAESQKLRENSREKQRISCQSSTNSLATCSA